MMIITDSTTMTYRQPMLMPSFVLLFLLLTGIKAAVIKGDFSYDLPGFQDGSGAIDNSGSTLSVIYIMFFTFLTMTIIILLSVALYLLLRRRLRYSEEDLIREEENQAYLELNSDEQELYFQSKEFLSINPYLRNDMTLSQSLSIQEKGIRAFEFQKDPMLTNSDLLILNRYELNFFKKFECSSSTNLPIPMKNDVYYFESKIFSLPNPEETIVSFGLGIKPYPWFRLPGRHAYSISYDSDGYRRYNQPFDFENGPPFPKCIEGDVIGIGYRVRSGTVFFTRNGKKISEAKIGGHIKNFKIPSNGQIYPIIGANNLCSIHVNIGQMGYVFIEGNVKKWGFAALEGNGPSPPAYNKFNADILLERSEIDDENDLSERESDFPPDFWEVNGASSDNLDVLDQDKYSYNAYSEINSEDERITLDTLIPPVRPPSYNSESDDDNDYVGNSQSHDSSTTLDPPTNDTTDEVYESILETTYHTEEHTPEIQPEVERAGENNAPPQTPPLDVSSVFTAQDEERDTENSSIPEDE